VIDIVGYFREIGVGLRSLASGMGVTFRCMFRRPVTVAYPRQTLTMTPRFRGPIELVREPDGRHRCIVCLSCQKVCPSRCLSVEGARPEGSKQKTPTRFIYNFTTCSLCGLCVESCRVDALRFSHAYNLAGFHKEEFVMDLLKPPKAPQMEATR